MQIKYLRRTPEVVRHGINVRPAITGVHRPAYSGDEDVRLANKRQARDARRAMRAFRRSLPKGTKI